MGEEVNDYEYEHEGEPVTVRIVDTRGVEELVGLTQTYFRGADGVMVVCANDDDTASEITTTYEDELSKIKGGRCPSVFVLNKCDEEDEGEDENENFVQVTQLAE